MSTTETMDLEKILLLAAPRHQFQMHFFLFRGQNFAVLCYLFVLP